jgi:hypothetical protein
MWIALSLPKQVPLSMAKDQWELLEKYPDTYVKSGDTYTSGKILIRPLMYQIVAIKPTTFPTFEDEDAAKSLAHELNTRQDSVKYHVVPEMAP